MKFLINNNKIYYLNVGAHVTSTMEPLIPRLAHFGAYGTFEGRSTLEPLATITFYIRAMLTLPGDGGSNVCNHNQFTFSSNMGSIG